MCWFVGCKFKFFGYLTWDAVYQQALYFSHQYETPSFVLLSWHVYYEYIWLWISCFRYLKGAGIGEDVVIEANTLKAGKTLAFLEVYIRKKSDGSLVAKGSHTKFVGNESNSFTEQSW